MSKIPREDTPDANEIGDSEFEAVSPRKKLCPACRGKLLPIAYGLLPPGVEEEAGRPETFVAGGCVVWDQAPDRVCSSCGRRYVTGALASRLSRVHPALSDNRS